LEIQQKLKTEKQNKHRHRKLQGKLPEENSKDLFFLATKKWRRKRRTTWSNVYDSEAPEFMCIIFYFVCQTSPPNGGVAQIYAKQ